MVRRTLRWPERRRGDGWERGKWERWKIKAVRSFCVQEGLKKWANIQPDELKSV